MISPFRDVLEKEAAVIMGFGYVVRSRSERHGIGRVFVQQHVEILGRSQTLGIKNVATDHVVIQTVARGEAVMEVAQGRVFVVIPYAVGEDHVVGGVGPQGVFELDDQGFAFQGVLWRFRHRGRDEDVRCRVVQRDIFIEKNPDLFVLESHRLILGSHLHHLWRCGVLRPARRTGNLRTAREKRRQNNHCRNNINTLSFHLILKFSNHLII